MYRLRLPQSCQVVHRLRLSIGTLSPHDSSPSLSAGAGAGIGISVLILLLAVIGGIIVFLRKRRRRLRARGEVAGYEEKPQLDDTSVVPQSDRFGAAKTASEDRQELEGSLFLHMSPKSPAELKAGPYSNRHELESRNR